MLAKTALAPSQQNASGTSVHHHASPSVLTIFVIGISESGMLESRTATVWAQNLDMFLRQYQPGYQLEEVKEHAVSFKVFFGRLREIKIDLLLSPYYADQTTLLNSLSEYKSDVELQRIPGLQWPRIVHT